MPRSSALSRVGVYVVLLLYCGSSVSAFLWMVSLSLKSDQEFISTDPLALPTAPSLASYGSAWVTAGVGEFFLNTVLVTVFAVGISVAVSALAAYVLARVEFPLRGLFLFGFTAGLMVPGFLILVPLYFLMRDLHLLGTLPGLVMVYVAITIPFDVFVLVPFFRLLPEELEEAAFAEGAGPIRIFTAVMLPLAVPGLTSVVLLNILTTWNEFFFAFVLLSDKSVFTIPMGLQGLAVNAAYSAKWVELFAGVILSMIPVLVMFAVAQDRITRGMTTGGLKG